MAQTLFYRTRIIILGCMLSSVLLNAQTRVEISPDVSTVSVGSTITVAVTARNVPELRAAQVIVSFDNTIVEFVESSSGPFLKSNSSGLSVFYFEARLPRDSSSPDTVQIDQAILGKATVTGDGDIVILHFRAIANGTTPVKIESMDMRDGANKYYSSIRVNGTIVVGSTGNHAPFFTTLPPEHAVLNQPYSYAPSINDQDGDTIQFQLLEAPTFINLSASTGVLSGTPLQLGRSKVSLRATDGHGGVSVQSYYLTVYRGDSPPSIPVLLSPPDGGRLVKMIDTLRWSRSIDASSQERIEYRIRLKGPAIDTMFCGVRDTLLALERHWMSENSSYVWYVEATDGTDTIRTRETYTFMTPALASADMPLPEIGFTIRELYPNPCRERADLTLEITSHQSLRITLHDITGREVARIYDGEVAPGIKSFTLNNATLASGTYLVQARGTASTASIILSIGR